MEQQIQDLVSSIQKEGIEKARAEAEKILKDASRQADEIIMKANQEKDKLIDDARKAIELERRSSEATIRQAARDVSLSLKKSIEEKFDSILALAVEKDLHGSALTELIKTAISNEIASSSTRIELSEADYKALAKELSSAFAKEIGQGLEFSSSRSLDSGIRICQKDGSSYIDLTGEECTKLLHQYLSNALKSII